MKISQKSYAKINLFLKVVGKKNQYHQLESLMAFLDLYDQIEICTASEFSCKITGEFANAVDDKNNILTKILDYFVAEFNISKNLEINLAKNIPVGAGLGGGSSNGCEFIKILNKIFSLDLNKEKMQEISLRFGSDIAFFFEDKASIIKGRGDIITNYRAFSPIEILLLNPKISLSTEKVFNNFDGNFSEEIPTSQLLKKDVFKLIKNMPNDLTKPAISIVPAISEILQELKNNQAEIAKMSGSGASCFAIFSDNKIDEAKNNLQKKFPDYFIKKVKILANV